MVRVTDGVFSTYTALGEKSGNTSYTGRKVSDSQLMKAYRDSWIVKKYIDKTVYDMMKLEREFNGDFEDSLLKTVSDKENRLNISHVISDSLTWASLLGDCLVVAITDIDSSNMISALSDEESIERFIVLPKGDFVPDNELENDITSPIFGLPLYYSTQVGTQIKIHHSRCHRIKLGKQKLKNQDKYGLSDIQAPFSSIKLFDTVVTCIADIIQDSNVDVLFIPNMMKRISAGEEDKVIEFVKLIKNVKSSSNMIALDAGDGESQGRWEQKTANYSGLSDILTKMCNVLAGALDRPITVLFGQSASGFASGEEDNKAYYETINALQEARLRPLQEFIDRFILQKIIPNNIEFTYPSIDSMNKSEEATIFGQYAAAISALVTAQIMPDKVAQTELIARGLLLNTTEKDFNDGDLFNGISKYPERSE